MLLSKPALTVLAAGAVCLGMLCGADRLHGARATPGPARIEGGSFTPFYGNGKLEPQQIKVRGFFLDRFPVTNAEFSAFVAAHPGWRATVVSQELAEAGYLSGLTAQSSPMLPVTQVSWFAASAFCGARGGRLPSTVEWEYAAAASETERDASRDPAYVQKVLEWYGRPAGAAPGEIGRGAPNAWGIYDLNRLVWEWTSDFNSVFVSADNRREGEDSRNSFCGTGSISAEDKANYAAFMRYAFRSSLKGNYVTQQLGFRCAYDRLSEEDSAAQTASLFDEPLRFVDERGERASLAEYIGRKTIVAMLYTQCAMSCPVTMGRLLSIEARLKARGIVPQIAVVSFDSDRDTPEVLAEFKKTHGIDRANWRLMHGDEEATRALAVKLGISYRQDGKGPIMHSNQISLLDESGRLSFTLAGLDSDVTPLVDAFDANRALSAG